MIIYSGWLFLIIGICSISAASPESKSNTLYIFSAAGMTGPVTEIAHQFEVENPGVSAIINFDSTTSLKNQISAGAPADIFISADPKILKNLSDNGLIDTGSIIPVASTCLSLIVPTSNPAGITDLTDINQSGLQLLVGSPDIPIGKYTAVMLQKITEDPNLGIPFTKAVEKNIVSYETTVAYLVSRIILGEADAGISYQSDISEESKNAIIVIPIPDQYNVIAPFSAGIVSDSAYNPNAEAFMTYLQDDFARSVLTKYGFTPAV